MRHHIPALLWGLLVALSAATADAQTTIEYYHPDPTGSVRILTDSSGAVLQRYDYHPFGEEPTTTGDPRRYAGKERDPETGYDYFGGRYYAARLGRFTTVDPAYRLGETQEDPQRWNRYAYVRNNPFRFTDPDGRILFDFQEFKAFVVEASHFGQDGYGYAVPIVAGIAAIGSFAGDVATLLSGGVAGVVRAAGRHASHAAVKKTRSSRPDPLPEAQGRPHSIIERPGPGGQYTTHTGDGTYKQYRGSGQDHGGISRPNVKENQVHQTPQGPMPGRATVRAARPDEVPSGPKKQ